MLRPLLLCTFVVLLWVLPVYAVEIAVVKNLILEIDLREGWSLYREPPDALIEEMAAHVAHEPAAANASLEQIKKVTRKRMAANEAIIYHSSSGAYLSIDFSALGQGESAPASSTLRLSAEFAAQSLEGEEGVSAVVWEVSQVNIEGVREAFQLSADYKQHDLPVKFVGIVGYAEGYWFFLYFTDPSQSPVVFEQMQGMLKKLVVRRAAS